MEQTVPVVTIDGPSGSGKGTIAALLASELGYHLLDSGALYRLSALEVTRLGLDPADEVAVAEAARELPARFEERAGQNPRIYLAEREVSEEIRGEACGMLASRIAAYPRVRAALLQRQRAFRRPPGLVADGRDMGTVVFPDAQHKIFLTASPEERAARRYNQLKEKGLGVSLAPLLADIRARDRRDAERSASPLQQAPDAHLLDTTGMPVAAVMERVRALLSSSGG